MSINNFKGFHIVNPIGSNLLTKPTEIINGFETYKVEVLEMTHIPYTTDVIAVCKLL